MVFVLLNNVKAKKKKISFIIEAAIEVVKLNMEIMFIRYNREKK